MDAWANPVKAIEIDGLRKIEKEVILSKLKSKALQEYSAQAVREDIITLYQTGYFSYVEVDRSNDVLTYRLKEKPTIAEIVYEGLVEMKSEDLNGVIGIKLYEILNERRLAEAREKLQKHYEEKGFFLARVDFRTEAMQNGDAVKVVFSVKENDKVRVKKITLIGNKALSDEKIKSKLLTSEEGYFSGVSGSGQYKQEAFEQDLNIIRFLYYNEGYVQAKVDRPQVTVSADKRSIYITIHIDEGDQYFVGDVDFSGDILFPKEELLGLIKIKDNNVFAYDVLRGDISTLTAKYGDLGYAYANVIPRTRFRDQDKKVDLVFEFDKGEKVYFGRINVVGNSKTRDKVIRRELKVREGELYNETIFRESNENVKRLGFFEDVAFKTSVDPAKHDIMNLDITVKERSTGTIQFGAGYSSSTGFTLQGSVSQSNFLGKGQDLSASLNVSSAGSFYKLGFTEPYFQDSQWALGGEVYQSASTGRLDYDEFHSGALVRTSYPIYDKTRIYLTYKYDRSNLQTRYDINNVPVTDLVIFPLSTASGVTSSVTSSVEFDSRNDRMMPTGGQLAALSYEYAGVGGDLRYFQVIGNYKYFKNVIWDIVWRNSFRYGLIDSLAGGAIPFDRLFLLGGPYSLRGYDSYRVGKMRFSQQVYNTNIANSISPAEAQRRAMRFVGGKQQLLYQGELQFPMIKEAGIMGVVFFDTGTAEDDITDTGFYSDAGLGLRWFSPIGPLRFEWGFPLNRNPDFHRPTVFEFSIGAPF